MDGGAGVRDEPQLTASEVPRGDVLVSVLGGVAHSGVLQQNSMSPSFIHDTCMHAWRTASCRQLPPSRPNDIDCSRVGVDPRLLLLFRPSRVNTPMGVFVITSELGVVICLRGRSILPDGRVCRHRGKVVWLFHPLTIPFRSVSLALLLDALLVERWLEFKHSGLIFWGRWWSAGFLSWLVRFALELPLKEAVDSA